MIKEFKDILKIRKMGFEHYIAVDYQLYKYAKILIWVMIWLNSRYKLCEIYRHKYKSDRNLVIVGLRWNGRNVKRRTSGFAKDYINRHRNPTCIYCQCKLNLENATADHIIPISKGGNNCQVNLMVCCTDCNSERGNVSFIKYIKYKNSSYKKVSVIFI